MVDSTETAEPLIELIFDPELMRPACVLLQAAYGLPRNEAFSHFDSSLWLITPTPGMRRLAATDSQWRQVAARCAQHHQPATP